MPLSIKTLDIRVEYHYAKYPYVLCHYAQWHNAECHYPECHRTINPTYFSLEGVAISWNWSDIVIIISLNYVTIILVMEVSFNQQLFRLLWGYCREAGLGWWWWNNTFPTNPGYLHQNILKGSLHFLEWKWHSNIIFGKQ